MNAHTIHLFIVFALIVLVFAAFLREWLAMVRSSLPA